MLVLGWFYCCWRWFCCFTALRVHYLRENTRVFSYWLCLWLCLCDLSNSFGKYNVTAVNKLMAKTTKIRLTLGKKVKANSPFSCGSREYSSGSVFGRDNSDPWPELMKPPVSPSCGARLKPSGDPQTLDIVHLPGMWRPISKICFQMCGKAWEKQDEGGG